ncbi:MAG: hypothetical protein KME29_37350 [Calothrix sp. FI2-JRJ7]|nr:hypothetical protein [Calothrix sp. FI2-JRJ7]
MIAASSGIGIIICQPSYGATLYNITDLGNLGSSERVVVNGINNLGQAVGYSTIGELHSYGGKKISAFRTAPNNPINPTTDNLGASTRIESIASGINDSGQVVGSFTGTGTFSSPFRTQPNSSINLETDNLLSNALIADSRAINNSGQAVVGQNLLRSRTLSYRTRFFRS